MQSIPPFVLPVYPGDRARSVRALKYRPKKRRRKSDDDEATAVEEPSSTTPPQTESMDRTLSSSAALLDTTLPRNFPHEPIARDDRLTSRGQRVTETGAHKLLANLAPPIFTPISSVTAPRTEQSSRVQHISVLTTILHRCLLEGDFVRAGRAWGMILRSGTRSKRINLRGDGRWGIGAEVLMWTKGHRHDASSSSEDGESEAWNEQADHSTPASRPDCLAALKEYYERLILHYPFNKFRPDIASSLDFYPAMFGLWIHAVQEERRLAERRLAAGLDDTDNAQDDQRDARGAELQEARTMAARMDELLLSPPYCDSEALQNLRDMVKSWEHDLSHPQDVEEK